MTSKTDSYTKPFLCFHSTEEDCFFKNHQNWQISRRLDVKTGTPVFHLVDAYGLSHAIAEFIVEDLGSHSEHELMQLSSPEKQQQWICQYLQERLDQAKSYQIHVERYGDKLAIRFGDYGLKGGGRDDAYVAAVVQVFVGITLTVCTGGIASIFGGALISSGLSTGSYTYQHLDDASKPEDKFDDAECLKQTAFGAVAGFVSGGVSSILPAGVGMIGKAFCQGVSGATGSAASTTVEIAVNKGRLPTSEDLKKDLGKSITAGLVGGAVGSVAGSIAGKGINKISEFSDDVAASAWELVFRKGIRKGVEGACSSAASKIATNYLKGKKTIRDLLGDEELRSQMISELMDGVGGAALTGGLLSAVISGLKEQIRIEEIEEANKRREQTQENLQKAKTEKANIEENKQNLETELEQSERTLNEKQNALKELQKKSQLREQKKAQHAEKTESAIKEARAKAERAEQQLLAAEQEVHNAQNQVHKNKQSLDAMQTAMSQNAQKMQQVEREAEQQEKLYTKRLTDTEKKIRRHLDKGQKANIDGKLTKNPEKIRIAYLQGKGFKWEKNSHTKRRVHSNQPASIDLDQVNEARARVEQTRNIANELQASYEQQQADLQAAQQRLANSQQQAHQTQAELQVAQEVLSKKADLKITLGKALLYEKTAYKNQKRIKEVEKAISDLNKTKNEIREQLSHTEIGEQDLLDKERKLTSLFEEYDKATQKLQENVDKILDEPVVLHPHRSARATPEDKEKTRKVEEAIRPDSVGFLKDSELGGLMPHVVLVQAITKCSAKLLPDFDSNYSPDISYVPLSALKFVLNSQGVVGHHLELEKQEFQTKFISRPHTHWSWNQLVQGNVGGDWEDAPIALLEPLSTFENSICNKPFGVAPYDTFVFGPHRLSEKSILLVPDYLKEEDIRAHLTGFKGRIVTYNPAQNLRSAVLETLKDHYRDIWHVCDENGDLIGGEKIKKKGNGYEDVTCLKKTNGEVLRLIRKEGHAEEDQVSESMKEYSGLRRFIGLHCHAPTIDLEKKPFNPLTEKEEDGYFQFLMGFTEFNKDARDRGHCFAGKFAGNVDSLEELSILRALKFYDKTLGDLNQETHDRSGIFDPRTGVRNVAKYVIRTAMHADLASLFYKKYPSGIFDLFPFELKIIFESMDEIIILLNSVKEGLKNGNKETALSFFYQYCSTLEERLDHMLNARNETQSLKEEGKLGGSDNKYENSLCLMVGLDDWETIEVPAEMKFDLGDNRLHSEKLYSYILKVLHVLPSNSEKCKGLYQYLSSMTLEGKSRKEQYRQTVLCSILRYAVQERFYLDLRKDKTESILAFKISKLAGWLQEYGLEVKDYTKKTGDCLFDNVAAQLGDGEMYPEDLRIAVVEFMRRHKDNYYSSKPDYQAKTLKWKGNGEVEFDKWEGYLTCISWPQVWATEIEVEALAAMLECPIVLMEGVSGPKIYNREAKNNPIFLHHMNMTSETADFSPLTDSNSMTSFQASLGELADKEDDGKVQKITQYLNEQGFELKEVEVDNNFYCNAFLESYKTLTKRKIPILDNQTDEEKVAHLRGLIASQYEATPEGSNEAGIRRAKEIKIGSELTANEGNLLAKTLSIPIRTVSIDQSGIINDEILAFSRNGQKLQKWNDISWKSSTEYIFIIDLGGRFVFAQPFSAERGKKPENLLPKQSNSNSLTSHPIRVNYFEACIPFKGLNVGEIYPEIERRSRG